MGEHLVLGLRILDPTRARLQIHRAQLPVLGRVVDALPEASFLLVVADREPVLDQDNAATGQHALELRATAQELAVFVRGAEAHHLLDPGTVIPAAIHEDHFAGCRQVQHVALELSLIHI